MKKLLVFLLGAACALFLVGGVAAWFLYSSPESIRQAAKNPIVLKAPSPGPVVQPAPKKEEGSAEERDTKLLVQSAADTHTKGGPLPPSGIFVEGTISLPPVLARQLAKKNDLALSVRAYKTAIRPGQNLLINSLDIVKPAFPFYYRLQVSPSYVADLATGTPFTLLVKASVCYDRESRHCSDAQYPLTYGLTKIQARVATGAKPAQVLELPTVIMNKHVRRIDSYACTRNGSTISGALHPTAKFLASPNLPESFVLMAIPIFSRFPPPPYGPSPLGEKPVGKEDVEKMGHYGILSQLVSFKDKKPVSFSFKIEEKFASDHYRLSVAPCKAGESMEACLLHVFPYTVASRFADNAAQGHFGSVTQGFEVPACGSKDLVVLVHKWDPNAPIATDASLSLASPPEIIEGAFY